MKHNPHDLKRAAFWLALASTFGLGLLLLFYVPHYRVSGALALGVVAVLVIKHVGLLMVVASPLVGAVKVARARLGVILRKHGVGGA